MAVNANKVLGLSLGAGDSDVQMLIPDFPFDYGAYLKQSARDGLGVLPDGYRGTPVGIVGGGVAGLVAGYELMKMGLRPVIYEILESALGGRFKSENFQNSGAFAEMGAMRFPISAAALFYYIELLGLETEPFPNPLTYAARSTLINFLGESYYVEGIGPVPEKFVAIANKWNAAIETYFRFTEMQTAIKENDVNAIKSLWNEYVLQYDNVSFHEFLVEAGFNFDEIYTFGQVGFGSGGWNTDFPNSILEIMRVVYTNADDGHLRIVEGTTSFIQRLWEHEPEDLVHWPAGTSLKSLNNGTPMDRVEAITPDPDGVRIANVDRAAVYKAVIVTPEKRVLQSGNIHIDTQLFGSKVFDAIYNSHYQISGKIFCQTNAPVWTERDPNTGRYKMSMTLSDLLTRGTYLFDESGGCPVMCLSYTWNDDTLKFLPFTTQHQFDRCASVLQKLYPTLPFSDLFAGDPLSLIWDLQTNFIGAFKNNLPGQYRFQRELFTAFKEDAVSRDHGIFLAGDDISWTGGWSEGAIHSALNAVWGIMKHFNGNSFANNPGPGDEGVYDRYSPIYLPWV